MGGYDWEGDVVEIFNGGAPACIGERWGAGCITCSWGVCELFPAGGELGGA